MIKMKEFDFIPYTGNQHFVYIGVLTYQQDKCFEIVNKLKEKNFRLYYKDKNDSFENDASAISNSSLCIFFISKEACNNLAFRNEVNYALNIKKNVVYFNIDNSELSHGLNMQLQNVKRVDFNDDSFDYLLENGYLTQDMIGEPLVKKDDNSTKKKLFAGIIAITLVLTIVAGYFILNNRIKYYNSPAYIYRNVDDIDYLKIEKNVEDSLRALANKKIIKLDISNSDVKDIKAIENIKIEEINISNNSELLAVWPLSRVETLKKVYIDQSQIDLVEDLLNNGIEIYLVGGSN